MTDQPVIPTTYEEQAESGRRIDEKSPALESEEAPGRTVQDMQLSEKLDKHCEES